MWRTALACSGGLQSTGWPGALRCAVRVAHLACYRINTPMDPLILAALTARDQARAPYSRFKVGAAVSDDTGRIFTGCNIESASYGLSMCAERVAIFKAISESSGKLTRIAVVAGTETLTTPCGACRQILWEFCRDAELILANLTGRHETITISQIYPRPFDASFI